MEDPILFDLDGTLVDSLGDIRASANHVRAHYGLGPLARSEVREMVGDGVVRLIERALRSCEATVEMSEAWPIYERHHTDQCTRLVQPYPGVREHLERWAAAGRALAVVTNKPLRFANAILDHLELGHLFGAVIGGDSTPERKPSPAPLREALRLLGMPIDRGTMVGDGVQDLRAGKAAGLRTAAVLFGFRDAATLRAEGADEYWARFGEPESRAADSLRS